MNQSTPEALKKHFEPHLDELCEDCKIRFEKNPLRLLDCKVDKDLDIMKNVPKIIDYLNEESKNHFEKVKQYLESMNIEYIVDPNCVRGLDYYTNTVFEVEAEVKGFGSQNVLCAGGRYNNLVKTLSGPDTPGVGFALGFERLITALDFENINLLQNEYIDVYVIPMSENEKSYSINLVNALRMSGYKTDMDFMSRNLKSNFKQSERLNSKYIIIVGEEEVKTNTLTIKNNETKEEYKVKLDELIDFLDDMDDTCSCGHHHGEC